MVDDLFSRRTALCALAQTTVALCALFAPLGYAKDPGCQFKPSMVGRWFQSGVQHDLTINSTFFESKGFCYEEANDKYLVYDKTEDCYRCLAIHIKQPSVLQYKETYCDSKSSMQEICHAIDGDAPLYSMFRKHPETKPIPCPFKGSPFVLSYNRGQGECASPPSRAESCTDESRMIFKYQACPDIPSSESNVEELVCLAIWKEGSTRFLIGKMQTLRHQQQSDEDQYRCFVYQRNQDNGRTVYHIAQSADASCGGLSTAYDGSRTLKLATQPLKQAHQQHCKFPQFVTDHHHTWSTLEHKRTYKFSQRNATLRISEDRTEMRAVCHGILAQRPNYAQVIVHATKLCQSGYLCLLFHKRDQQIIELQMSEHFADHPDEACSAAEDTYSYQTLVTAQLHQKKCPYLGKFTLSTEAQQQQLGKKKKKRRRSASDSEQHSDLAKLLNEEKVCQLHDDFRALSSGCTASEDLEFRTDCLRQPITHYQCHGHWDDQGVSYIIASLKEPPAAAGSMALASTTAAGLGNSRDTSNSKRYCLMYRYDAPTTLDTGTKSAVVEIVPLLRFSATTDSCHRNVQLGVQGVWALNFTSNGTCAEYDTSRAAAATYNLQIVVGGLFVMWLVLR